MLIIDLWNNLCCTGLIDVEAMKGDLVAKEPGALKSVCRIEDARMLSKQRRS